MFLEIIQEREGLTKYSEDMLHALTSRWFFMFLTPNLDKYTVIFGMRLLYTVYISADNQRSKLKDGMICLDRILKQRSNLMPLYIPLWGLLCGSKANFTSQLAFEPENLLIILGLEEGPTSKSSVCGEVFPTIMGLIYISIQDIIVSSLSKKSQEQNTAIENTCKNTIVNLEMLTMLYRKYIPFRDLIYKHESIDEVMRILFLLLSEEIIKTADQELQSDNEVETNVYSLRLNFIDDLKLQETDCFDNMFTIKRKKDTK
jgi:hypothetical protein